jgi:hypothetical protein
MGGIDGDMARIAAARDVLVIDGQYLFGRIYGFLLRLFVV